MENEGLVGVTVKLTGPSPSETLTDASGQYAFAGLRAGNYTIEISGFDEDDVAFSSTSSAATIAVGESKVVTFQGTYLRTSAIKGQVTADEEPQEGITVTVQGKGEEQTTTTNATGQYSIENLRAGDYSVVITGYDTDQMSFETTSQTVTVGLGETANAPFAGILLRTGGIAGTVTVDGEGPIEGVTVTIQGEGENESRVTDNAGEYMFDKLPAGDYSVRIVNPNADEYGFDVTSQTVEVELKQTATASFEGILLRTAAIAGAVTLRPEDGGAPLANVAVTISGGPKNEQYPLTTNNDGTYRVDRLHAGDYSVEITNPDADEYGFDATSRNVTVDLRETLAVDFSGTLLRTVMATGMVTVEDFGPLEGVEITISGGLKGLTHTATTDADGMYEVGRLYAGTYAVTMTNPNDDEYGFDMPMVDGEMVELRETLEVDFSGILLRTVVISGTVSLRDEDGGAPLPNVAVTISGGPKDEEFPLETRNDGTYRVDRLHAGEYSVEVMNPDADEYEFDATMRTVEVDLKETGNADFSVTLLRTVTATGMVSVEDFGPLEGVEVTISGGRNDLTHTATTDADGMYEVDRLYAGEYSVTMANPNDDEYGFDMPMVDGEEVDLRETLKADFSGILLRTAVIAGKVTVGEGTPLSGVTLTVSGGPKEESHDATTNAAGEYEVDRLHQGDYTVSLKDFNRVEYGFDPESVGGVMAVRKDTETVNFRGIYLRTAGVSGSVTVPGVGNVAATVTLSMEGEDDQSMETQDGQYGFAGLAEGDYTLTLSGYDAVEYRFDDTREFSLELNESKIENFVGKALRTGTIMGSVTDEDGGIEGIAVTLIRVISATSGEVMGSDATDDDGNYSFGPLLAGGYQVTIAGYDDEHDFGANGTTMSVALATDGQEMANFAATFIRTASVSGMVTVDDEAMPGVTVTLTGGEQPEDGTSMETGDDGRYSFDGRRKGTYTVTLTNEDENAYSFPTADWTGPLAVGQHQGDISFSGTQLKRGSISGQVHAEGDAISGVAVTLSGDADADDVTDDNGEYNFPGLAVGNYTVTIEHPGAAYVFTDEELTGGADIVNNDDFVILDFEGKHARTASVMGRLFIDEGPDEGEYHSSEPMLTKDAWANYLPDAILAQLPPFITGPPLGLLGPNLNDPEQTVFAGADGNYEFPGLVKGEYRVRVVTSLPNPLDPTGAPVDIAGLLATAGYALGGENNDVGVPIEVTAGGETRQDFPFLITKQTINVGAVMGTPAAATNTKVGGVKIDLYATADDAAAERDQLGSMTTGGAGTEANPNPGHGTATFEFARSDDKGPGGNGNDHLVWAKVTSTGHADLAFSDNKAIGIQYDATARESNALAAARLVNLQLNTQWWVKSNATAKDGDNRLAGWKVKVGDDTYATADSAAATVAAADHGKATYTKRLELADVLGATPYSVRFKLDENTETPPYNADQPDEGEDWRQSAAVGHVHNHLSLPADNTAAKNDLGPIYVTWTTQKLTIGVYREADDTDGFTDFRSALAEGDHRPHTEVGAGMEIELLVPDARGRLERFEWDPDKDGKNQREGLANVGRGGMVTFERIPSNTEITVRYRPGTGRKQIDYGYDEIEAFNDASDTRHNDLMDFGPTMGAFGSESGGQPEVKMCTASATEKVQPRPDMPLSDEWCATFAYQWTTGEVYGSVGGESGHDVDVSVQTGQGAIGDEAKTGPGGRYSVDGLQDGEYTATAKVNGTTHALLGPAAAAGIELYHIEECWAATNPDPVTIKPAANACVDVDWAEGMDADGNTTYKYANRQYKEWRTGRIGLSIKGYVANDGQDGENRDDLLRGDESMAGIVVTASQDNTVKGSGTTDASGFYSIENLAEGSYTIEAGAAANAIALHAITPNAAGTGWNFVTEKTATAHHNYPATFPDEQEVDKPYWIRNGHDDYTGTMGQSTSPLPDTDAKLYNFALVYTDGQLTGSVNNLSGSNASIDMLLTSPVPGEAVRKTETAGSAGTFEYNGLTEGIGYSVEIEDKGYSSPCLNASGAVDDLCPIIVDSDNDGTDDAPRMAPTSVSADVHGEDDHQSLDALIVYDGNASALDSLGALSIMGVTALGGDPVEVVTGGITVPTSQTTTGTDAVSFTPTAITWASARVTVKATVSADANYTVKVGTASAVRASATTGATVTLATFNKTVAGNGPNTNADVNTATELDNAVTVKITAENGYNDHEYTFNLTRANPIGNQLENTEILYPDTTATGSGNTNVASGDGDGSENAPFRVFTATQSANTVRVTFDLYQFPTATSTDHCAQTVRVFAPGSTTAMDAPGDNGTDFCEGEEYVLTVNGSAYRVEVLSEDGVKWSYYVLVKNGDE